jgi:phosphotriesterase-related protein
MYIQTVTGPIPPEALGITLAHEHIVIDLRCAFSQPPAEIAYLADAEVGPELLPVLRQSAQSSRPNLVLEGDASTLADLANFRALGGKTIVDMTNGGLHANPRRVREIALESGVQVVLGCGYYRQVAQDEATLALSAEEIRDEIVEALLVGLGDSDVRAGIIGEVGTTEPLHPFERRSLIGSAQAQRRAGVAINVHPDLWGRGHLEVLDILEGAGADLSRTAMSHVDEIVDSAWHERIAERGVYLSFDTFGSEFAYDGIPEPRDTDRVDCLLHLLDRGYGDRLLLSQDICYKIQLTRYGGQGYGHVLANVVPALRRRGVTDGELRQMLVENPARLLAIEGK